MKKSTKLLVATMLMAVAGISSAFAKKAETIKIICPYGVGGTADAIARKFAEVANKLHPEYNFIVEQKTGGDGFAAAQFYTEEKASKKDLLVYGYGVAYRHDIGKKYGTELVDFDRSKIYPVASVDDRTWILYALPGTTLADVLEKAKNGGIKMSGGNPLSDPHLALGSLIAQEGGTVKVVPYDGGAAQKKGLIDKEVDVFVGSTQVAQQEVEAGTLVPILAFSDKPFNGFVAPSGKITVPSIAGSAKAVELNAANDYSGSILAAGGFIAVHKGAKQDWIDSVKKVAQDVWASKEYSEWIDSILLNNFQVYDKDAASFLETASKNAIAAYEKLK